MRSILTMLGLIIGISSVVAIVSLGNGASADIESNLSSLGINSITINEARGSNLAPSEKLTLDDMDFIMENFDEVDYVTPSNTQSGTILSNIEETGISFSASTLQTKESEDLTMVEGRFLNDFDINGYKKNIVIDSDLAEDLYGTGYPIGESILVTVGRQTSSFTIIGVYEKEESLGGFSQSTAYLPYTTMDNIFRLEGYVSGLKVTYSSDVEDPSTEIQSIITAIERSNGNYGDEKYDTFSAEDMIETVNSTLGTITLFISAIAAISLLVGGIGVMNIMLVSVTERTREIGIRKALGAQYADIMLQFLIEAITISILGGLIGSVFGGVFTSIGGSVMDITATVSMDSLLLAVVFSTSIGIFFGIYPANKAAKLDPIEALRHE